MLVSVVACASLVQLVCGSPARFSSEYAVKDYHRAPRGWNNEGPAPADHVIDLSIGLTQSRFKELERHLYEVSDPRHARYGQHLSDKEVHSLVRPTDDALEAVHHWLEEHEITTDHLTYTPAKDWMKLSLPVSAVEKLLDAEYSVWEHQDGSTVARTESWSLPLHIHEHISTIQPTNSWARLNPRKKLVELEKRSFNAIEAPDLSFEGYPMPPNSEIAAVCNFSAVSPDCLRTLYGTINYTPQSGGASRIGLTDYLEEYNNRSDTYLFLEKFRPEAAQAAYEFAQISIAGGPVDNGTQHAEDGAGLEGNLDAEYILGIAWPLNLTAYSTGGRDPTYVPALDTPPPNSDEPYLAWANYALSLPAEELPQVISTSYGDDEQTVSRAYATAVCNQFAQLGARGVSLLFASGDAGVGGNDTCYSNADNTTKMFLPSFPNSCPYVTNVGATYLYPEQAAFAILSDGGLYASGAGFSNYFPQPKYQESVVQDYVSFLNGTYDGLYNKTGRAYPDISCVGQRFPTIWNGSTVALVGTSGSTPICSSILALVNDALLSDNKPALGFLNPWLYGGGYEAFTDVTNGSSYGCQTDGFPARVGWDAVTGWGTPYFPDILGILGFGEGYGQSPGSISTIETVTATATATKTGAPVSQISDGQPQAPTGAPVTQISDGQPQAPTGAPVSQISDGQPQAPTGTPVSQISDGQPQVTTSA